MLTVLQRDIAEKRISQIDGGEILKSQTVYFPHYFLYTAVRYTQPTYE